ncbi:MAG: hypothetical protein C4325_01010 [Blastocatellia bacterium]
MTQIRLAILAAAMILSIAFTDAAPAWALGPSAKAAQTAVRKKRKPGAIRSAYRGGKWVTIRVYRGGKWVTKRVWRGSKSVGRKTYKTGRKVTSRSKKIIY